MLPLAVAALTFLIVFVPITLLIGRNIITVPPNKLVVITGRKRTILDPETRERQVVGYRLVRAGSAFRVPFLERIDELDLTEHDLEIHLQDVSDADRISGAFDLHANAHVGADDVFLDRALERLLGLSRDEVRQIILSTLEARFRTQVASRPLTVAVDWSLFSAEVEGLARDDLASIGIELDSLVVMPAAHVPPASEAANKAAASGV